MCVVAAIYLRERYFQTLSGVNTAMRPTLHTTDINAEWATGPPTIRLRAASTTMVIGLFSTKTRNQDGMVSGATKMELPNCSGQGAHALHCLHPPRGQADERLQQAQRDPVEQQDADRRDGRGDGGVHPEADEEPEGQDHQQTRQNTDRVSDDTADQHRRAGHRHGPVAVHHPAGEVHVQGDARGPAGGGEGQRHDAGHQVLPVLRAVPGDRAAEGVDEDQRQRHRHQGGVDDLTRAGHRLAQVAAGERQRVAEQRAHSPPQGDPSRDDLRRGL
jgi:hypothetical protein